MQDHSIFQTLQVECVLLFVEASGCTLQRGFILHLMDVGEDTPGEGGILVDHIRFLGEDVR